jgi:toxin YhaV
MSEPSPLVVNGWTIFAHPLFLEQLETLIRQIEVLKQKDSVGYRSKNTAKRLAAIAKLAFEVIPQDPGRAEYRQGTTLGEAHKHWFRAKFFQPVLPLSLTEQDHRLCMGQQRGHEASLREQR